MISRLEKNKKIIKKEENIKKFKVFLWIFFFIFLIILNIIISNKHLVIDEHRLQFKDIPEGFNALKIIHFNDLNYTGNNKDVKRIVKEINIRKPDIVFFSGRISLSDNNDDLIKELSKIKPRLGKYYTGNDNKNILRRSNFKDISKRLEKVALNKDSINLIGITSKDNNFLELDKDFTIALIDKADDFDSYQNIKIDLAFSGGQGGIFKVPFTGKGLLAHKENSKYIYGVYDNKYIISAGLGNKYTPFRFFNPRAIDFIRIAKN